MKNKKVLVVSLFLVLLCIILYAVVFRSNRNKPTIEVTTLDGVDAVKYNGKPVYFATDKQSVEIFKYFDKKEYQWDDAYFIADYRDGQIDEVDEIYYFITTNYPDWKPGKVYSVNSNDKSYLVCENGNSDPIIIDWTGGM